MSGSRSTSTAAITVAPILIPTLTATAVDVASAVAGDGCYGFYSP